MKKSKWAGLLIALLPAAAIAQSSFDGTWKFELGVLPVPKTASVWLLQNGMYQCKSCKPPIDVMADGRDQNAAGQHAYDTISIQVVDDRTIRLIEKKSGRTVSDEKFTVAADGNTATDEFANWKETMTRIAKGPAGSHALSGSWRTLKIESASDKGLLITYKLEGDVLNMSGPTGQSYMTKLDGTVAPYNGDSGINGVSVKRVAADAIEETDYVGGKAYSVSRITVAPDGRSMSIEVKDVAGGTTARYRGTKQ